MTFENVERHYNESVTAARRELDRIDSQVRAPEQLRVLERGARGLLAHISGSTLGQIAEYKPREWADALRPMRSTAANEIGYAKTSIRDAKRTLAELEVPPEASNPLELTVDGEIRAAWRAMSPAQRKTLLESWASGKELRALIALARSPLEFEREPMIGAWREHGNVAKREAAEWERDCGEAAIKIATALISAIDHMLVATTALHESVAAPARSALPARVIDTAAA